MIEKDVLKSVLILLGGLSVMIFGTIRMLASYAIS